METNSSEVGTLEERKGLLVLGGFVIDRTYLQNIIIEIFFF